MQVSFASGEITPLLHARVDLAKYQTGLAELTNMIVLPQGGVTRRPGVHQFLNAKNVQDKLIPFEYNSTDTAILDFSDKVLYIWYNLEGTPAYCKITTPYAIEDVKNLRYVQSGNVIFLAHRKYKPRILSRISLRVWELKELDFKGGPFITNTEFGSSEKLYLYPGSGKKRYISGDIFSESSPGNLVGTLVKLEYTIPGSSDTITSTTSGTTSRSFEVKGTFNVVTSGKWTGTIEVVRNASGRSEDWITVRRYRRSDTDTQGQWDFSISEAEDNIRYAVRATHDTDSSEPATVDISASGFLKNEVYKVTGVNVPTPVVPGIITIESFCTEIEIQEYSGSYIPDSFSGYVNLWSIGAWGLQGYPGAIAMYQDRLVFAATDFQPQTIWLSRVGDYADFSISDPLQDDDAVTLTLAGSSADGIHSLLTSTDLLAFTNSEEWVIKGAGDAGAITPTALTAHQQTNIGSKDIQPILVNGHIIMVQSLGKKVFSLGYNLNTDGYSGSEISILSEHLLADGIIDMAYQKIPDSLLWFVIANGDFVSCTYNPEHEVIGWANHVSRYPAKAIIAISGSIQTNIYMIMEQGDGAHYIFRLTRRGEQNYIDIGDTSQGFESIVRTLRLNYSNEEGHAFSSKNLIPRVVISAQNSREAWVAPGNILNDTDNWERRRKLTWEYSFYLSDAELQLDNGFDNYACLQVRNSGTNPLTIAAIIPQITAGG